MSEMLLQRYKTNVFLHRIVTGDEKWIYQDNPKRKQTNEINTKAKYSRIQGNALYLVGSEGCGEL